MSLKYSFVKNQFPLSSGLAIVNELKMSHFWFLGGQLGFRNGQFQWINFYKAVLKLGEGRSVHVSLCIDV